MVTLASLATARRLGGLDPARLASVGAAAIVWGASTASAYAAAALRFPMRTAVIDDHGTINYWQLDLRTTRIAGALQGRGVRRGDPVGILCRNHRGFVEANVALAKLGTRTVYLNPTLPASQLQTVVEREGLIAVLVDDDLQSQLDGWAADVEVIVARPDLDDGWSFPELGKWRPLFRLPRPTSNDDPVVLTSGTTGPPKGTTRRPGAKAAVAAIGVLEAIPYRQGDVVVLPAPLFHAWGLSQLVLTASLGGTVVLRRRFDPEQTLADVEAHGADVLAAVPVMLHRMLDVGDEFDTSSLRIVASSGSALPGQLATRWLERFGPNLYNLYGSTEVGQVSIATPEQLTNDSSSAGLPLRGIDVRIVDDTDHDVAVGAVGRIVVASAMHFDGYTDGGDKERIDGHMSIGDLGRIDASGQLFVLGRADDMIISGGENLFPSNIERALLAIDDVVEAAVVGVADDDLGQRVRAVIVPRADADLTLDQLKSELRPHLASYEMPREFVLVDALPRNGAGKVLRRGLIDGDLGSDVTGSSPNQRAAAHSGKRKNRRS